MSNRLLRMEAALALAGGIVLAGSTGSEAAVISFQQGVAGYTGAEDTMLVASVSDYNFGAKTLAQTGNNNGDVYRSLMRFDLSFLNGQYAQINSITLTLTHQSSPVLSGTVELRQPIAANAGWVEGSSNGATESGASSWGYKQYNTATWSGGGGLGTTGYGPVLASAAFNNSMAPGTTFDLTISNSATATSVIDGFLDGTNEGFFLKSADESVTDARNYFASSEYSTTSYHPILTVDYTPAPPPLTLGVDFGDRGTAGTLIKPGFSEFLITTTNVSQTRSFLGGVEVTVSDTGAPSLDDRNRTGPTNSGAFTDENLLRDAAGPLNPLAKSATDQVNCSSLGCDNFGSWHPGACQFVLCDGSVRSIAVQVDVETLRRLAMRKDGLPLSADF